MPDHVRDIQSVDFGSGRHLSSIKLWLRDIKHGSKLLSFIQRDAIDVVHTQSFDGFNPYSAATWRPWPHGP